MTTLLQPLKIKATIVLIFISTLVLAQNFSPFNANVTKRFYNPANTADNSYFFYPDSSHHPASGKTIFHQYFTLQSPTWTVNTSNCGFWTGGGGLLADTTWLGVDILYDSISQHLLLKNYEGDTLDFDFSILPGDSATFFESTASKYYIKAGSTQTETVYTVTDAVKTFTVLHYNATNQVVNSPLHGKQIKLGQQTGLIQFIDAYHFPAAEKHLVLKGQLNPLIGTYQIRFEDLYPFQPGDSLQYQGSPHMFPCTVTVNYRVLARTETADSVTIVFGKSVSHNTNVSLNPPPPGACPAPQVYPGMLKFPKNSDLMGFPYNQVVNDHHLTRNGSGYEMRTEDSLTFCGSKRRRYTGEATTSAYCQACACLGSIDAFEQEFYETQYADGFGILRSGYRKYQYNPQNSHFFMNQIYSSIGGQVCGTYYAVGLPQYELSKFSLHPNPAVDELTISSPIDELSIISADGTAVQTIFHPASTIAIGHLNPGLYILRLKKGERTEYTRIIKL